MVPDTYKTIERPGEESLYKEKGSKFYGYTFPVTTEEEVEAALASVREKHHKARHFCYAWQLGIEETQYRVNDDGEPTNSAGMPIYGQIQAFEVTNLLIVSVRYFGGIKLGVGGLITAYKTSAKLALEASQIETKIITKAFKICFDYPEMGKVMEIVNRENLTVTRQILELECQLFIAVRKRDARRIFQLFDSIYKIEIEAL